MNTKGVNKGNISASPSTKKEEAEESNVDSDGYAYSFSRTRINFQGASGMGMGGSYASTYFAGEDKKMAAEKKKHPSKPSPSVQKSYTDTTAYIEQSYPEPDTAYSSNKHSDTSSYKQEWQQYNW
ncbi:hypothetical protein MYP_1306 [Sporocytophaga myxococcoides]|uniref:Uncharacterized protein n=2 Tax=Sporocytophaga myxococcoides TaxID=153721 RepID=A0A098LCT0_9BACT|nr:hypothetical protein MYP_1306 [Sporocytophaga myxococcoides]